MKSLQEWNKERADAHVSANTFPKPNGIACPKCAAELQDLDAMVLTSYPTQRNVGCSKCDFRGYRVS